MKQIFNNKTRQEQLQRAITDIMTNLAILAPYSGQPSHEYQANAAKYRRAEAVLASYNQQFIHLTANPT